MTFACVALQELKVNTESDIFEGVWRDSAHIIGLQDIYDIVRQQGGGRFDVGVGADTKMKWFDVAF